MANSYCEFSTVIPHLTEEETEWLKAQFEMIWVYGEKEYHEKHVPEEFHKVEPDWIGYRAYRELEDHDCEADGVLGFEHEFTGDDSDEDWGRHLWIYSVEFGDTERVAYVIQKFLQRFRPGECWSMTWAETCSKPRVGEFGGGGVFVTAESIEWCEPYVFVDERARNHRNGGRRLAAYHLALDGSLLREQRKFLLELQEQSQKHSDQYELLAGLIELTDELADQAHDKYGIDCLIEPPSPDESCECERPGQFCSGVPGILAQTENGKLVAGAKVERCDLCMRYRDDDAALQKLIELGIAPAPDKATSQKPGPEAMRFDPPTCPECGEYAKGTFETVPGLALLMFDADGEAEYFGQTDMCWDMQTTDLDEQGRATLICPAGHT